MQKLKLALSTAAAVVVSVAIFGPGAPSSAEAQDLSINAATEVHIGPEFIDIQAATAFNSAELRISGPGGYALTLQLPEGGSFVTADLLLEANTINFQQSADGQVSTQSLDTLPDGVYTYELVTFSADGTQQSLTGQFHVNGGAAVEKRVPDNADLQTDEGLSQNSEPGMIQRLAGTVLDFLVPSAHAQTNFSSGACVGPGCTGTENMPLADGWISYLKMKRSAPSRIYFENTSAEWPDWALVANAGTASSPQNYFSIKNIDQNRTPFRIDALARDHALRILDDGNVGLGLAAPQARLHIRNSGSTVIPTPNTLLFTTSFTNILTGVTTTRDFRIQHLTTGLFFHNDNGLTAGFSFDAPADSLRITAGGVGIGTNSPTSQLHVAGDALVDTNLRVANQTRIDGEVGIGRTAQAGTALIVRGQAGNIAFRVQPDGGGGTRFRVDANGGTSIGSNTSAPPNGLFVSGNTGMGTNAPSHPLHVTRADGTARVFVNETSGTAAARTLFDIRNNGATRFVMENTSAASGLWTFSVGDGSAPFVIGKVGSGVQEMALSGGGDVHFGGDVYAKGVMLTSTREAKTDFEVADEREILEKLAALDILQWRYKHESEGTRHIGPIAEEFHEIFGFSDGKTLNMIDTNGITFAAIKALNDENKKLSGENRRLSERLDRLEAALNF